MGLCSSTEASPPAHPAGGDDIRITNGYVLERWPATERLGARDFHELVDSLERRFIHRDALEAADRRELEVVVRPLGEAVVAAIFSSAGAAPHEEAKVMPPEILAVADLIEAELVPDKRRPAWRSGEGGSTGCGRDKVLEVLRVGGRLPAGAVPAEPVYDLRPERARRVRHQGVVGAADGRGAGAARPQVLRGT